jgi:hypothetical protein
MSKVEYFNATTHRRRKPENREKHQERKGRLDGTLEQPDA